MNITQKEEFRYRYAGQAMQALIGDPAFIRNSFDLAMDSIGIENIKGDVLFDFVRDRVAHIAVLFANALIAELEKGKEGGRQ